MLADAPPYLSAEPIYIVLRSCCLNAWRAIHYIATGHYRDGILLTPATAHVMAQPLSGETPSLDLTSFSPARNTSNTLVAQRYRYSRIQP
ncbi:MAG: hypothetical protein ABI286_11315 [Edaphobacter sp.]